MAAVALGLGSPIGQHASAQPRAAENASEANEQTPPPATNAVENGLARIAGAIEAAQNSPSAKAEQRRAQADLEAQRDMARWALGAMWAAIATVIVSATALFLIWRTLYHTRRAAQATERMAFDTSVAVAAAVEANNEMRVANEIARDTAKRQLRAYVAPDSIDFSKVEPGNPLRVRLWIKNSGQTPAKSVNWQMQTLMTEGEPAEKDFILANMQTPPSRGILGAQQRTHMTIVGGVPFTDAVLERIAAGDLNVFLFGVIEYVDTFGDGRGARFRFQLDPHSWHWFACSEGNEAT